MTVFYLTLLHYSSAGEKQFICFTAAACWQKEHSFVLPLGWISENNTMQNQIHVFTDKEGQDSIFKAWCLKCFCFNSVNSWRLVVNVICWEYNMPQLHLIFHKTHHKACHHFLFHQRFCTSKQLTDIIDANTILGYQPDNEAIQVLLVEQSIGGQRVAVFLYSVQ